MKFIILIRNPNTGSVSFICDEDGDGEHPKLFKTEDEAEEAADSYHICGAWPYNVVRAP